MEVFSNKYLEYLWMVKHPLLLPNYRYLDDICTINSKYFGDIAKDIYDNTLLLEGNARSYR